MTVTRREYCHSCRGAGWLKVAEARCHHCQGTGIIRSRRGTWCSRRAVTRAADRAGSSTRSAAGVPAWRGNAHRDDHRADSRGRPDGARIRVSEKGNAGERQGAVGDLFITVQVDAHDTFQREGDDLHITVPIAVHEAALGARIDVPSPDGTARLRVPPGTQTGQRFHIRGRGVPSPRSGERGDLVVEVKLVLPQAARRALQGTAAGVREDQCEERAPARDEGRD